MRFAEVLDAVGGLPIEEQTDLLEIVRRRLIEHRRDELALETQEAHRDFAAGRCHPKAPDEILRDILS